MARVNWRAVEPSKRRDALDMLSEVLATMDGKKQVKFLLQRLLTESEVLMLSRRLQIAELLIGGRTYEQIQRKLNVGTATIRGVDGWLSDAAYEYQLVREEKRKQAQVEGRQKRHIERRGQLHRESHLPGSLRGLIHRDSRMILFRLLLGDF